MLYPEICVLKMKISMDRALCLSFLLCKIEMIITVWPQGLYD